MRSRSGAPMALKLAAAGGLLFLHLPLLLIFLYAFTTEEKSYQFPPPGLTLQWFAVAWGRDDIWAALGLSLRVAAVSTLIAMLLGSLAAGAVARSRFFGRETVSLLIILPIALPGIITGISLRAAFTQIGRAHVCTPVTNAHLVCRLLLDKKKQTKHTDDLI